MFKKIKISKLIVAGFCSILFLLLVLSIFSYHSMGTASKGFKEYRGLARDTNLSGTLQANMLMVHMNVKNFLLSGRAMDIKQYSDYIGAVHESLTEAEKKIQNPDRAKNVTFIKNHVVDYENDFEQVQKIISERDAYLYEHMNPEGVAMRSALTEIMTSAHADEDLNAAYYAGRIQEHIMLARLYAMKFLDTNIQDDADRFYKEIGPEIDVLAKTLDENLQNIARRTLFEQFLESRKHYTEDFNKLSELINKRNDIIDNRLDRVGPKINKAVSDIKLSIKKDQDSLGPVLQAANDRTTRMILLVSVCAIALGLFLAWFTVNAVLKPLGGEPAEMAAIAKKIANRDPSLRFDKSKKATGLYASMQDMAAQLQALFAENEKQLWISEGLFQISDIIRGNMDLSSIANSICQFVAQRLDCQIITFYLAKEDKLDLAGSYAFNKKNAEASRSIALGEGFVGQAAKEKRIIQVSDLPEDYTRINSSIGEAKPRSIIVVPFLFNNEVQAVMELGVFKEISTEKLEFLEGIIEPLGVSLKTITEQLKTKQLLEETQCQAEELQSQQEELKTANETLQEQTQLLKRSEEELQEQSEELRVSNEELEEKQEVLEKQKEITLKAKHEIEQKAEELARASKYKSEFLANMSHELRTPLNSLLLLSKHLADNKKGHLDESEVEDAKIIYSGGHDLLTLINDIMDLSKVEAGMLGIDSKNLEIESIAKNLQKLFYHLAKEKGVSFEIVQAEGIPAQIKTDGQRLEQILKNLLANAIKFTENGSVTLEICRPNAETKFSNQSLSADTAIAFRVIDTGIGIPAEKMQIIFEAFQQQDGSTCRKYGGTGLGLSIARELAHLLGGEIQLQSSPGQGSVFTLYLPVECQDLPIDSPKSNWPAVEEKKSLETAEFSLETMSSKVCASQFIPDDSDNISKNDKVLLIIEDDKNFAKILRDHGRDNGYKCLVAGNGRTGLCLANDYEPKGILLDIGLPDIDGHQVLEQLKFSFKTRHIPVQIISARDENSKLLLSKGAIGYLTKPVDESQLTTVLQKFTNISKTHISSILVIEDDYNSQQAVVKTLESSDIKLKCVNTGEDGLAEMNSTKYDCIILDLKLPGISGFDVLKKMTERDLDSHPPVIIFTGRELTDAEQKEIEKYAATIIIKGAGSFERLLDDVSLFLHKIEANLPHSHSEAIRLFHDEEMMLKDRRVLLVDDDMRNSYALSKGLIEVGLDVEMVSDGQQAVDCLEKDSTYELILMDIMMPVMDGYEATRRIRRMSHYNDVPIIALTAKAMPEDRELCLKAGASEYITKPIDLKKLLSIIRIWLFKNT